jgi:hypothetical protein
MAFHEPGSFGRDAGLTYAWKAERSCLEPTLLGDSRICSCFSRVRFSLSRPPDEFSVSPLSRAGSQKEKRRKQRKNSSGGRTQERQETESEEP